MGGLKRQPRVRSTQTVTLPVPAGLSVSTVRVGPDEYALLSFPLPAWVPPSNLGRVEREIALRLLGGESAAQIARVRGRSLNTVRNQIRALYAKLCVTSLTELATLCGGPLRPGAS